MSNDPKHISDAFDANEFLREHIVVIPVTVPPKRKTLGIPYAQQGIFHGRLYQQCPVCDVRVFEDTDEYGERETNNYGKHYEEEHS